MPEPRPDAQRALRSLVDLVRLRSYTPEDIMSTRQGVYMRIQSAARSINAGIAYYAEEPQRRIAQERQCLEDATLYYEKACEAERKLPLAWHEARPHLPPPEYEPI